MEPKVTISAVKGEANDLLLECAIEARVDAVVTGDKELFGIGGFRGIKLSVPTEIPEYPIICAVGLIYCIVKSFFHALSIVLA